MVSHLQRTVNNVKVVKADLFNVQYKALWWNALLKPNTQFMKKHVAFLLTQH